MIDKAFAEGLRTHFRVVGALVLRETRTRFGKSQMGYLWALIEPTLFVVSLVVIFRLASRHKISGQPLESFFMCGIVIWFLFINTQSKTMVGFSANRNLLAYPQVSTFDILITRMIIEITTSGVVFMILALILIVMGVQIELNNFLLIVYAFVLATVLGAGIGLLLCAAKYYFDSTDKVAAIFLRFVYFGSGAFYSLMIVPPKIREVLLLNPMAHLLEIGRIGLFRGYQDPSVSLLYPLWFSTIAFLLGLMADRLTQSKVAAG